VDEFGQRATDLLHTLTGASDATLRAGQLDAIRTLVTDRRRALVVQRTGWGKSAVYFIATRLLRDDGAGPTLLVSPLLALMRNQIEAAARMGIRAATINSANAETWHGTEAQIARGEVDLLLVSPERLANRQFRDNVLDSMGAAAGLVVVDEAHCISDWGHDFRPDYRRIKRLLDSLPPSVPVLACTATANDRVVADVVRQLGEQINVIRGPLGRDGLSLQVIDLATQPARLAWLARTIPELRGSGIVYCLTKDDVERVTGFLNLQGIVARGYTGASEGREELEQALLRNEVKVLVATSALGMGFDKPDLAFVIHYQSPGSVISYYQQVGRAGRQLDTSYGVLLRGAEDREIQNWFIETAFPDPERAERVLRFLESRDGFVKLAEIESAVNIKHTRLTNLLKNLEVEGALVADGQSYQRTAQPYHLNDAHIDAITQQRRLEQDQMTAYGSADHGCRMRFLQAALDDPTARACGICDLCNPPGLARDFDPQVAHEASTFLRHRPLALEPRKRWPVSGNIPESRRVTEGRVLCRWGDGGWGPLVRQGKQTDDSYDDQLVDALVDLVRAWSPLPAPEWVTWVPSLRSPDLVASLAGRVAERLGLPSRDAVVKTRDTEPQQTMENSAQQFANVKGAFAVRGPLPEGPVLLIDDTVDSRWTLTYIGSLLREAGCAAVIPVALALRGGDE
jgi:ATP-dependent DNA helicase RecQ